MLFRSWDIIKGLIDLLFGSSNGTGRLGSLLIGKTGGKFGFYAILLIFVLSGPIVFTVLFSRIIYKLQTGRILSLSYVYPVVYTAVAFVTFVIIGVEFRQGLLFFKVMGYGYWITMALYIIAVKYSGNINSEAGSSSDTVTNSKVFNSLRNFFDVNNTDSHVPKQDSAATTSDYPDKIANKLIHHIKNTNIVHRDSKTTATAFLDTLFKVVTTDTELATFTKNYTNAEIKSNLSNILLLCNKRKYSEALAEVTKYIKPLLNRKAAEIEPKAKADITEGPVNEFKFSFSDDISKKEIKPQKYSSYCPECGTGLESSDKFCPECGRKKVK